MAIRWILVLVLGTSCATSYQFLDSGGCAADAPDVPDLSPLAHAYDVRDIDEPPRTRWSNDIDPDEWRGPEGMVVVQVVILESGRVHPTQVIHSVNDCVDALAVETARTWLFHPGRINGQAVAVVTELEFSMKWF